MDQWLSWEETEFIAGFFDLPLVPVIEKTTISNQAAFEKNLLNIVKRPGTFQSIDALTRQPCTMEGIVTRDINQYGVDDFARHVFKYVRKGHVKTDEHWTRNWKRAPLKQERKCGL